MDISAKIHQLFQSRWLIIMTSTKAEISFQKSLNKCFTQKKNSSKDVKAEAIPLKFHEYVNHETIVQVQKVDSQDSEQEVYSQQLRTQCQILFRKILIWLQIVPYYFHDIHDHNLHPRNECFAIEIREKIVLFVCAIVKMYNKRWIIEIKSVALNIAHIIFLKA